MRYTTQKPAPLLSQLELMAPDSSKTTLRQWLKAGRIAVDGEMIKAPHHKVDAGVHVELQPKSLELSGDLRILYSDSDLVVVDKPAGLLSVESRKEKDHCAHAILKRHFHPTRVFPVHRLDQATSGVMVFALTQTTYHALKEQFSDHSITRRYRALVEGLLDDEATIDTHLYEDKNYHMHVHESRGVRAITHYKTLQVRKNSTLLELTLETGKKNQIRVHLAHLGHPVLGDTKYGSGSCPLGRLALHAAELTFVHPQTQKEMNFTSTESFS